MSYPSDIAAAVAQLDRWKRAALATMCAASISPIIERFAQAATKRAVQRAVTALWQSALYCATDPDVTAARALLDSLPESDCDDSNVPAHNVMAALGVVAYALDVLAQQDSGSSTILACTEAASRYAGYDHALTHGNQIKKIDPRSPPAPARLESLQIDSQCKWAECLRNVALSRRTIEQMRAAATTLARELDDALTIYAARRGWNL